MAHFHRSSCRICEAHESEVGRISATGLCGSCGERRHLEHNRQMVEHSGEWFDYWRARSLAALGVPLSSVPVEPR